MVEYLCNQCHLKIRPDAKIRAVGDCKCYPRSNVNGAVKPAQDTGRFSAGSIQKLTKPLKNNLVSK